MMAFRRELSTEIGDEKLAAYNPILFKINDELNMVISSNGRVRYSKEIYMNLDGFEISLRKIYKESGLQMRMQTDASRALFGS